MTVRLSIVLAGVFLAVNLVNAMRKEGDFDVYVEAARSLLTGTPLLTAGEGSGHERASN